MKWHWGCRLQGVGEFDLQTLASHQHNYPITRITKNVYGNDSGHDDNLSRCPRYSIMYKRIVNHIWPATPFVDKTVKTVSVEHISQADLQLQHYKVLNQSLNYFLALFPCSKLITSRQTQKLWIYADWYNEEKSAWWPWNIKISHFAF